jgi:protein-S-isoprenylcysteine O-methyltransferase Ste14
LCEYALYAVLLFLAIPLILGSWWSFLVFLIYPVVIAVRIKSEEKLLTEELEGYKDYKTKVKYKMIPFIW